MFGLYSENGKENGNYCSMFGLNSDNGKENGNNYYSGAESPGKHCKQEFISALIERRVKFDRQQLFECFKKFDKSWP